MNLETSDPFNLPIYAKARMQLKKKGKEMSGSAPS
jgi:hypothetical protein